LSKNNKDDKLDRAISIQKREHIVWQEWQQYKDKLPVHMKNHCIVGQYQYLIKSKLGTISIVELPNYFRDGITFWEIYSLEGNLFEDCLRFNTYEEALKEAKQFLRGDKKPENDRKLGWIYLS